MNTRSLVSQSNITLDRDINNNARAVTAKIHCFLTGQPPDTPFLVVNLNINANPAPEILKRSHDDRAGVFARR
jgi:hypothetical protein